MKEVPILLDEQKCSKVIIKKIESEATKLKLQGINTSTRQQELGLKKFVCLKIKRKLIKSCEKLSLS